MRITASDQVVSTELPDGGGVLLDLKSELYFGLNDVGVAVWEGIVNGRTFDEIVGQVHTDFGAPPAQISDDVAELLAELRSRGLVSLETADD